LLCALCLVFCKCVSKYSFACVSKNERKGEAYL
jgi:hypothetical protein